MRPALFIFRTQETIEMQILPWRWFSACLIVCSVMAGSAWAQPLAGNAQVPSLLKQPVVQSDVVYNKAKDTVSISSKGDMLSSIFSQIGKQSGIDIRMDPKIEVSVTINVKDMPLERAIDAMTKGLNVLKSYESSGKKKDLLVQLSILPAGQYDASTAISLMSLDREIGMRAGQMYSQSKAGKRKQREADLLAKRWQARQSSLNAQQQKAYQERLKALEERALVKEQQREAKEKKKAERLEKRLAGLPPQARERVLNKPVLDKQKMEQARRDFSQPAVPPAELGVEPD